MRFEPNVGQTSDEVRFVARGAGYAVFLTSDEIALTLASGPRRVPAAAGPAAARTAAGEVRTQALRMKLVGAAPARRTVAEHPLGSYSNYLVGKDASKWKRFVPHYGAVRYEGVYEGVDAVVYGSDHQLEYDFVVAPGADAGKIRVRFDGQRAARVDASGDLVLELEAGRVVQQHAHVYQDRFGTRRDVAARYAVTPDGEVTFELGDYDASVPLVVDPVVVYGDFLGGAIGDEKGAGLAVDSAGAAYVTGTTFSSDFPTTPGAFDPSVNGGGDAFVTKLAPDGASVVYSTYIGGSVGDEGNGIAVDATGSAFVVGTTESFPSSYPPISDFPVTDGAYDTTHNGSKDVFVAKLSPNGASLTFATFIGCSTDDYGLAIALDGSGDPYVTGYMYTFPDQADAYPTTPGAFQRTPSGLMVFVTKLQANGSALAFSTFVGQAIPSAIAVDAAGRPVVLSDRAWSDYPTTPDAYDRTVNPDLDYSDAAVTKLDATGSSLVYSTYLGGVADDYTYDVAVDPAGSVYVLGSTTSTDFPTTAGAYARAIHGSWDVFVTKFDPSGSSLAFSTYLGGTDRDFGGGIAVDGSGTVYVAGTTYSDDFPTTPGALDATSSGVYSEGFVATLSASGAALGYATYLGGTRDDSCADVAVDASGAAYVAGTTGSLDFPTAGGVAPAIRDNMDVFVTKLAPGGGSVAYSAIIGGVRSPLQYGEIGYLYDQPTGLAVGADGSAYITGATLSPNFPTTPGAYSGDHAAATDCFVSKIAPGGDHLLYSTFVGGYYGDQAHAIAVDSSGAAYIAGITDSFDFPTTPGALDTNGDFHNYRGFVTKLSPDGSSLGYSTFYGGGTFVTFPNYFLAVDGDGRLYILSSTPDIPATPGAFQATRTGENLFVCKLDASGSSLLAATFVGGEHQDFPAGLAIDAAGAVYLTGSSTSVTYPTTTGSFHPDSIYEGVFVTKLAPSFGSLVYSTFIGAGRAQGVAVDADGNAYITGRGAFPFPTTPGAYDTTFDESSDAFVTKLDATGSALVFSTFYGGSDYETATAISVDATGGVSITGQTKSPDLPVTPGAFQSSYGGGDYDGFVARFAADGSRLTYSTYLGGSGYDVGTGVAALSASAVFVAGVTDSPGFPAGGFGVRDGVSAFVFRIDPRARGANTVGVYAPASGVFFLRNSNSPGNADVAFGYGPGGRGWVPLDGDWDGDGIDTPGLYDPSTGSFFLKNTSAPGPADLVFSFGAGGAGVLPVVGDFDGDGVDTIGIYVQSTGAFFLKNTNAPGPGDVVFTFGAGGTDVVPVFGDYDGNGTDTVGIYNRATGFFFLKNTNGGGAADLVFGYGPTGAGIEPIFGDYDGNGTDTVGVYVSSSGAWFLKNANGSGNADLVFSYGPPNLKPLVGDWNGQ